MQFNGPTGTCPGYCQCITKYLPSEWYKSIYVFRVSRFVGQEFRRCKQLSLGVRCRLGLQSRLLRSGHLRWHTHLAAVYATWVLEALPHSSISLSSHGLCSQMDSEQNSLAAVLLQSDFPQGIRWKLCGLLCPHLRSHNMSPAGYWLQMSN